MNEEYKDIEARIKSMLENAEEEVPGNLWAQIESSLDRPKGNAKTVVLNWKRMAATIVAAAALIGGLFIGLHNYQSHKIDNMTLAQSEVSDKEPVVIVENPVHESMLSDAIAELQSPVDQNITSYRFRSEVLSGQSKEDEAASDIVFASDETVPKQTDQSTFVDVPFDETADENETDIAETQVTKSEYVRSTVAEEDSDKVDPFAIMELKDSRKKHKWVAVTAGGNISSNGNPASMRRPNMHMAPGVPKYTNVHQVSKESTYSLPISLGLGVRFYLTQRLSVGIGVDFSILERTFSGIYTEVQEGTIVRTINSDIHNTLHYIGVPVVLSYDFLQTNRLSLYVHGGGVVEKALSNKYRIENRPKDVIFRESVDGVQLSAGAGLGIKFKLTDKFGLYLDPSVKYYFDCKQPVSIRTQQPLMFNLEAGLRLDI